MYKVTVKSHGKYNNVRSGARYCFTKCSVIDLAVMFTKMGCVFTVEKFVRIHGDIFTWSEGCVSLKVWEKIDKALDKESKG